MKSIINVIADYLSPKAPENVPADVIALKICEKINKVVANPYMENVYFKQRKFEVLARKIYPHYHTLAIREFQGRVVDGIWFDNIDGHNELANILIRVQSDVPQVLDIGRYKDSYSVLAAHMLRGRSIAIGDPERHAEVALKNGRDVVHIQGSTLTNDRSVYAKY